MTVPTISLPPTQEKCVQKDDSKLKTRTHDLDSATSALRAELEKPSETLAGILEPMEGDIRAALKAKKTPTAIAKLLKGNGIDASLNALRTHVVAIQNSKPRSKKRETQSARLRAVS
jgi:hypothetical protein